MLQPVPLLRPVSQQVIRDFVLHLYSEYGICILPRQAFSWQQFFSDAEVWDSYSNLPPIWGKCPWSDYAAAATGL